jgi:hypothetical protein
MVRGGLTWSIDVVGGGGTILAEVASPPASKLAPPKRLRPVLVREVTGEKPFEDEHDAARQHRPAPRHAGDERPPTPVSLSGRRPGVNLPIASSRG